MATENGPERVIMIQAGKYQYAEVDLDEGIHLAGDNNSGKTTLIATLQFLYIDNENAFKFTRTLDESKRYYFKNEYSYILFECMTANGYVVIGARGTSGLHPGKYERFCYKGSYSKEDFFQEDGQVKNGREVKLGLSEKEYQPLKPAQLRAALTGTEFANGVNLNLLPIKNKDGYRKFRNTYKNLLELSNVGQEEVKEALIHICHTEFRTKGVIAIEGNFSQGYERIKRKRQEIDCIRKMEKYIRECISIAKERASTRAEIVYGHRRIVDLFRELESANISNIEEFNEKLEAREEELAKEQTAYSEYSETLDGIKHDLGGVDALIDSTEKEKGYFEGYLPQFEEPKIDALIREIEDVEFKLKTLSISEPETVIQNRIDENQRTLESLSKRVDHFDNTFAKALIKDFSQEELSSVFSLINEGLLGESTRDGLINITDYPSLKTRIKEILSNINENTYSDESITVKLSDRIKPKLSNYFDIEEIKLKLTSKERQIKNDKAIIETAREKDSLLKLKKDKNEKLTTKRTKQFRYKKFQEEVKKLDDLVAQRKNLEKERGEAVKKQNQVSRKMNNLNKMIDALTKGVEKIKERESSLRVNVQNLQPPHPDWTYPDHFEDIDDGIEDLLSQHEKYVLIEQNLSNDLTKNKDYIESGLYGSVSYSTEEEFVQKLTLKLEEIDKEEEAVNVIWKGMITGLMTDMRDLLEDVNAVKNKISQINRTLRKTKISDLTSIEILIEDNKSLTNSMIKMIKNSGNTSLLSIIDQDQTDEPLKELQERFLRQGKIDIKDLFSLKFKVVKIDDSTETFSKLKNVESNGTMITIKVLVNIILLKGLFDPKRSVRIPFYLDEISSLDDKNATSITQKASELGFTPVIASPNPSHIVSKVYTLKSGRVSGLYVDSRNKTIIEAH